MQVFRPEVALSIPFPVLLALYRFRTAIAEGLQIAPRLAVIGIGVVREKAIKVIPFVPAILAQRIEPSPVLLERSKSDAGTRIERREWHQMNHKLRPFGHRDGCITSNDEVETLPRERTHLLSDRF